MTDQRSSTPGAEHHSSVPPLSASDAPPPLPAGLILLPLAVPLLIFAAAFCANGSRQPITLEAAISILLLAGAPFVAGAAIRASRT